MKNLPKTRTEQILSVMPILAWVACIGFIIEGGSMVFSYGSSLINPEAAKNLYKGLDLYNLSKHNFWHYTLSVVFAVTLSGTKAWSAFQIVGVLSKFNLKNPFTMEVAQRLEKVSIILFVAWLVTMLSNLHNVWLMETTDGLHGPWLSGEFIFFVGIVFIIAQVFKRGVEIQSENELTV